jgi:DNA repair protein RecN (Recombination protein N)
MLLELRIRNFAIIDELQLTFAPGLNILTGETGAGKSIIIDAVGLLLGDRAATELVRDGSELASIETLFELPAAGGAQKARARAEAHSNGDGPPSPAASDKAGPANGSEDDDEPLDVRALLEAEGLDDPEAPNSVTLAREVRLNGRNICRINGRSVSLQLLADVAAALIDIHGQGEHLNLLKPRTHIHLLDRYAGLLAQREQVAELVSSLRGVRSELARLRQDARTLAQRLDLLSFQVNEIDAARLIPGEEAELESERRRLANAEALLKLAQAAEAYLSGADSELPGALDLIGESVGRLEKLARIDPDMRAGADDAQALLEQLTDLARTLGDYAEALEFNPERLAEVEERIDLLHSLKRKYGDSLEQVIAFGQRAQQELDELGSWEVKTAALEAREQELLRAIGAAGAELTRARAEAGERLARAVEQELADLKMERARFGVSVAQAERSDGALLPDGRRVAFDALGVDRVEFLVSANPGEALKPMARVASGGETARLMLALKGVLAHAETTPTLIFDEIDQGIGGRVGGVVGHKLWALTSRAANLESPEVAHQVLCITHLPQLAAYGDAHFTVNKQVLVEDGRERTTTVVRVLDGAERLEELVTMLGAPGDAGRHSVEEMLREVQAVKQAAVKQAAAP